VSSEGTGFELRKNTQVDIIHQYAIQTTKKYIVFKRCLWKILF